MEKGDTDDLFSCFLKNKALDVQAWLPKKQANHYDSLKDALLKRYCMTEEGYKHRFYSSKAEVGQSSRQFITRLDSYIDRYIELAGVEKTFEGLRTLAVREQYLTTYTKDLEVFIRERAITDLAEVARHAEQYKDAHRLK